MNGSFRTHFAAKDFNGAIGNDFIAIHIALCTRTGLPNDKGKMIVQLSFQYLIADLGAVSEPVARSMAEGAVVMGEVDVAVSVTGVAGPGGGTALKPVGLVHIACARKGENIVHEAFHFGDIGRTEVRIRTAEEALQMMLRMIG